MWIAIVAVVWFVKQRERSPAPASREAVTTSSSASEATSSSVARGQQAVTQGAPAPGDGYGMVDIPLDTGLDGQEASLARNFYFIFDGSGSMRSRPDRDCGGDQKFESKLAGAQWALHTFLEKVPADINLGLYVFDDAGQREVAPLGTDREAFVEAVDRIETGGRTPLAEAIRQGTDQLVAQYKNQLGYGEYRLVVITDGKASGIPEAAAYAGRFGMPIYAIGLCIGEDHPLRREAVSYRAADSFEDLAGGLEETLAELPGFDATTFGDQAVGDSGGAP